MLCWTTFTGSVYEEEDDFDAFYDSDWNFEGYSDNGKDESLMPVTIPATIEEDDNAANGTYSAADVLQETPKSRAAMEAKPGKTPIQHALTIYLNNLYN